MGTPTVPFAHANVLGTAFKSELPYCGSRFPAMARPARSAISLLEFAVTRVGKGAMRRAHHDWVNVVGGHASLCPPYILRRYLPRHPEERAKRAPKDDGPQLLPAHPSRRARSAHLRMTLRDAAQVTKALICPTGKSVIYPSSPFRKNISLRAWVETAIEQVPSRAHQEGRYASSRT